MAMPKSALENSGFTLVELIVVITILAILAVIGFLSLQWYADDASVTAVQSNLRNLATSINTESVSQSKSARAFIVEDADYELPDSVSYSGEVFDTGSNYTAGKADYQALKLNEEKFLSADGSDFLAWAVDVVTGRTIAGSPRFDSLFQVAGFAKDSRWYVYGNYVPPTEDSADGLILNPSVSSWTGAILNESPSSGWGSSGGGSSSSSGGGSDPCDTGIGICTLTFAGKLNVNGGNPYVTVSGNIKRNPDDPAGFVLVNPDGSPLTNGVVIDQDVKLSFTLTSFPSSYPSGDTLVMTNPGPDWSMSLDSYLPTQWPSGKTGECFENTLWATCQYDFKDAKIYVPGGDAGFIYTPGWMWADYISIALGK